jgi:uncharacterized membrane protein YoaK (UPF0700 family)
MEPAEANSLRPGWVLTGGCLMAFLAAAVNADFMVKLGVSVSHLTGDMSRITTEAVRAGGGWSREASLLCVSVSGFVTGAAISGFFVHHPRLDRSRPYGRCIAAVGAILISSAVLSGHSAVASSGLAALACGIQNALATHYRGIVLRTTHITGLLTDLGQMIGMRLRGHHIEGWKISTPLLLAVSFAAGATTGSLVSLVTPVRVTLIAGAIYVIGGLLIRSLRSTLVPK